MPKKSTDELVAMQTGILVDHLSGKGDDRYSEFGNHLDNCSPRQIAKLDKAMRIAHKEVRYLSVPDTAVRNFLTGRRQKQDKNTRYTDVARNALLRNEDSALLFSSSHDGRVRERAVPLLNTRSKAGRVLLLLRCNDWVGRVRAAALRRLETNFLLEATVEDFAPLVYFVLEKRREYGRGGAIAAEKIMSHAHWPSALRLALMNEVEGPLGRILRTLLRTPEIDDFLTQLATSAASFQVRLVATQTILEGKARLFAGRDWQWIDKTLGKRRRICIFDERQIQFSTADVAWVLSSATDDKCARLRKLAAEYLIRNGPQDDVSIETVLFSDGNPGVKERMDFFKKKWAGR